MLQKRLRKEKKARRRLQEQMEIITDKPLQQMVLPPSSQPSGALGGERGCEEHMSAAHENLRLLNGE